MTRTDAKEASSSRLHDRAERLPVQFPVKWAQGQGISHDISATGMYFLSDRDCVEGSLIELNIELDTPAGALTLQCEGEVRRVAQHDGKTGIAVRFTRQEIVSSRP